jgi:hypothetical protein
VRKKHIIGALAGALALVFAAVAVAVPAAQSTLDLTVAATPSKAGTKSKPKPTKLTLTIDGGPKQGGQPATTTAFVVKLPKQLNINSKKWPKKARCSLSKVNQAGSVSVCPKGSKVGSGSSQALAANGAITQNLSISAHALTNGNVGFFLQGSSPVSVAVMLEGKISGRTLTVGIPTNVQEPIPGIATGITLLKTVFNGKVKVKKTFRKGGKKVKRTVTMGAIESTGCKGGKWTVSVTDKYRDGVKTVTANAPCKK